MLQCIMSNLIAKNITHRMMSLCEMFLHPVLVLVTVALHFAHHLLVPLVAHLILLMTSRMIPTRQTPIWILAVNKVTGKRITRKFTQQFLNMSSSSRTSLETEAGVARGRVKESDEITTLRSHLQQSVFPVVQSTHNNSLANSTTSIVSQHSERRSVESMPSKDNNNGSVEKENHPNVIATPSPPSGGHNNDRKLRLTPRTEDDDNDVSDIDRRLSDLQKFLDKARSGILAVAENDSSGVEEQS